MLSDDQELILLLFLTEVRYELGIGGLGVKSSYVLIVQILNQFSESKKVFFLSLNVEDDRWAISGKCV